MPVATALLRPRRLRRARAAMDQDDAALVADLLSLAVRLAEDAAAGGETAGVFRDAFAEVARQLADRMKAGAEAAQARLEAWAASVAGPLGALGEELGGVGSPADAARAAESLLDRLSALAGSLDAESLRPHLQVFFDALQVDLGLSPQVLEEIVWALLDQVSAGVRALPPHADPAVAARRRETVGVLRRIRRRLHGRFALPFPTAAQAAGVLAERLRRLGVAVRARGVACAGRGLADAAGAVARVAEAVPFGGAMRFGTVGAAAADAAPRPEYAWYASWLLDEDVRVNAARTQVLQGETVIHSGTGVRWHDAPLFQPNGADVWYSFRWRGPDVMEGMAYWSAVGTRALEMALHLAFLEPTDYATKSLNALAAAGWGTQTLLQREPLPTWVEWLAQLPLTVVTSLEGIHHSAAAGPKFWFWTTLMIPDVVAVVILKQLSGSVRDVLLSVFTLINHAPRQAAPSEGQPDRRAENRRKIAPLVGLFVTLTGMVTTAIYPRSEYDWPFREPLQAVKAIALWNLLVNTIAILLGATAAEFGSWPLSGAPDVRRAHEGLWKVWLQNVILFLPSLYSGVEGSTRGGTFNGDGPDFAGYPKRAGSPYRLPYPAGQTVYVNHANQGFWGHNHNNRARTYAVDFALDQDDPVLASRPGTVVDYFDWVPDDTDPETLENPPTAEQQAIIDEAAPLLSAGQTPYHSWNFVVIRHDRNDDLSPLTEPLAGQDRGPGGTRVVTFAVYGHGRKGSVRAAFAARTPAVATGEIIGTVVRRGDRIMAAGNTGNSLHNQVHMHVQPQVGAWSDGQNPAAAVRDDSLTIPFVFHELTRLIGDEGVPLVWDAYTSENG